MPRMSDPVGASQRNTTACATTTDCRLERFVVGGLLGALLVFLLLVLLVTLLVALLITSWNFYSSSHKLIKFKAKNMVFLMSFVVS